MGISVARALQIKRNVGGWWPRTVNAYKQTKEDEHLLLFSLLATAFYHRLVLLAVLDVAFGLAGR